jgi:hypothetical protein
MFSGMHELKRVDNSIFLDRDGTTFQKLVNYLRNDRKIYPEFENTNDQRLFTEELNYWCIKDDRLEEKKLEQINLVMGFKGLSYLDKDYYTSQILAMVLGIYGGRLTVGISGIISTETYDRGLKELFIPYNVFFAMMKAYTFAFQDYASW